MDARDPGSNSELSLLRKLARSGRTVSIIGVLTNIDRLNSAASLEAAREQARTVLREACRSSGHVELAGVVALNTRAGRRGTLPGRFRLLGNAVQSVAFRVRLRRA